MLEERLRRRLHESEGFSSLNPRFLEGLKMLRQRKRNEDRSRIHQENLVYQSLIIILEFDTES